MSIDWGEVEKTAGFKSYAKPGIYKVKCIDVDIHEVGSNGAIAQDFLFEESNGVQYPKATHWLTFKEDKAAWRQWHNRQLMVVLGLPEETAEKTIEKVESSGDKEKIVKGYESAYKQILVKKKPTVEIEVYLKDRYSNAEFTDERVAMPHDSDKPAENTGEIVPEEIEVDGNGDIDLSELPF